MTACYHTLTARDQIQVATAAFNGSLVILWALVWNPLRANTTAHRDDVATNARLLGELERAAGLSGDAAVADGPAATQSLVVLVDNTSRPIGLAQSFTRTRPDGPNAINVSFQNAPFDQLMSWLAELDLQYAVAVESVSISEARDPGLVNGQLALRRM
jgi:general secretion pathway protein M